MALYELLLSESLQLELSMHELAALMALEPQRQDQSALPEQELWTLDQQLLTHDGKAANAPAPADWSARAGPTVPGSRLHRRRPAPPHPACESDVNRPRRSR